MVTFLDPSIYVVTLYEIVGGGDFYQSRELSPRFACRQQLVKLYRFVDRIQYAIVKVLFFNFSFLKLRTRHQILSIPALTKLFSQIIEFQENQIKCALQGFGKLRLQSWMEKKFKIDPEAWRRLTPTQRNQYLTKFCRGPKPPLKYYEAKGYAFRIPRISLVKGKPNQKKRPTAERTTKRPKKDENPLKKSQASDDGDAGWVRYDSKQPSSGRGLFSPIQESELDKQFQTPPMPPKRGRKRLLPDSESDEAPGSPPGSPPGSRPGSQPGSQPGSPPGSPPPKKPHLDKVFEKLIMSSAPGANKNKRRPKRNVGAPKRIATPSMKITDIGTTSRHRPSTSSSPETAPITPVLQKAESQKQKEMSKGASKMRGKQSKNKDADDAVESDRPRRNTKLPAKLATPSMKTYQPKSSTALQIDNDDIDLGPYEPETREQELERKKRQDERYEQWKKKHGYEKQSDKGLWYFD